MYVLMPAAYASRDRDERRRDTVVTVAAVRLTVGGEQDDRRRSGRRRVEREVGGDLRDRVGGRRVATVRRIVDDQLVDRGRVVEHARSGVARHRETRRFVAREQRRAEVHVRLLRDHGATRSGEPGRERGEARVTCRAERRVHRAAAVEHELDRGRDVGRREVNRRAHRIRPDSIPLPTRHAVAVGRAGEVRAALVAVRRADRITRPIRVAVVPGRARVRRARRRVALLHAGGRHGHGIGAEAGCVGRMRAAGRGGDEQ